MAPTDLANFLLTTHVPHYILTAIFLTAAQARFTSVFTPHIHEHMIVKSERTADAQVTSSLVKVDPWWHQRIIGAVVGMVGALFVLPDGSYAIPLTEGLGVGGVRARRLEVDGRLVRLGAEGAAAALLAMGFVARIRSGMSWGLPVVVLGFVGWAGMVDWRGKGWKTWF